MPGPRKADTWADTRADTQVDTRSDRIHSPVQFLPTRSAAFEQLSAVRPGEYARSRNFLTGAVTCLSPYITHGLLTLPEVLGAVNSRQSLDAGHKFIDELGWREYFRHVWAFRSDGIFESLHEGPLPEAAYSKQLPASIREAATGVPVIDMSVRTLYETGYLHNHARMWLASYVVHVCKVHWRVAADWMYGHLLDGDLASNHLSWQWVAGTGSHKPYLFNADNVARYAPQAWHSPGTVIDQSYEALDQLARQARAQDRGRAETVERAESREVPSFQGQPVEGIEPALLTRPSAELGWKSPDPAAVEGREVWLIHPWNLGELPAALPADTLVVGILIDEFHRRWPWSERRWRFVSRRMNELASVLWHGDSESIGAALARAYRVHSIDELHLKPWLKRWANCAPAPTLFPSVDRRCDSFSRWRTHALKGMTSASDLLLACRGAE